MDNEANLSVTKRMVAGVGICWIAAATSLVLFLSKISEIADQPTPDMAIKWMIITGGTITVSFITIRICNSRIAQALAKLESQSNLANKVKNLKRVYGAIAFVGPLALYILLRAKR